MQETQIAQTAAALVAQGRGILAIDESLTTIRKRFDGIGVESTQESRRRYRDLLINAAGSSDYISGMILFDETIRQCSAQGEPFPEALKQRGILCGIKVDKGLKALALHSGEKITEGLDGLRERLAEYVALGARFAKWRAVTVIDEPAGLPRPGCLQANAHALARYAALCQEAGLVPVVEPEVLMDGTHGIQHCQAVTEQTLRALFVELAAQQVPLGHLVLKTSMVISGAKCAQRADVAEVARRTVQCLQGAVPSQVAGIVFLSGGQGAVEATEHLNRMNREFGADLPWPLSFSYGRALQEPCLKRWAGQAENTEAAQKILLHREMCNSRACMGRYSSELESLVG